jgi:hypothetical protein
VLKLDVVVGVRQVAAPLILLLTSTGLYLPMITKYEI